MKSDTEQMPGGNILIVDDSQDHLDLVLEMLTQEGYQVNTATNGTTALQLAQTTSPHLILLDINLPDLNGYEVCRRLKTDNATADIPVIFVSALTETLDKTKAFAVGGVDYVTKPFQVEEILSIIKTHLTLRNLEQQLDNRLTELQTLNTRLQSEMGMAREIQQKLLPPPSPNWPDLDVICYTQPAREVGGDFYAFIELDDRRRGIAVGDVSGKGAPAAMAGALSVGLLQAYAPNHPNPELLLSELNKDLCARLSSNHMNAACCYAIFDLSTLCITVANAGCMYPYLRRNGRPQEISARGLPLGAWPEFDYTALTLELQPNDMIVFSSDGLVEAQNEQGELFGFERFQTELKNLPANINAQAAVDHLVQLALNFTGPGDLHDDITILVARIADK